MKKIMMNTRMNVVVTVALVAMFLTSCAGLYITYTGFTVDGLAYSILDETEMVKVSRIDEMVDPDGAVSVPGTVLYGEINYTVVGIESVAFYDCVLLTRLFLPENLTEIGNMEGDDPKAGVIPFMFSVRSTPPDPSFEYPILRCL